jgi:nitrite reductase (NO-forming)
MKPAPKVTAAVAVALVAAGWLLTTAAGRDITVEYTDFGVTTTITKPAFDARLKPASTAGVKEFRIPMTHDTIEIANGVRYVGWTFGGTVPGPTIRVREGDVVRINLINEARDMAHSIDFHASRIPMNHAMKSIAPGDSLQFEFTATTAGVFMVHCGTPPVLMHIAQGMYMAIIVDPRGGWPTKVDKEFVVIQSEFYAKPSVTDATVQEGDWNAMLADEATHVVFNGRANQYVGAPFEVAEGDRVRIFVMNAGPNRGSAFHVVGAIFDAVYPSGNPSEVLHGVQTWNVAVGGGAVFETTFEAGMSGTGSYAFVTHAFADATKGAVGMIKVGNTQMAAGH